MEERTRDDGFEATFVVSTPRAKAWELLMSAAPASDVLPPPPEGQRWIPGIEGPAEDIAVEPGARLHCRKTAEPCRGTEIVVVLEDADAGTRITIVQSGFGEGFADRRPWLTAGWHAILADVVAFFERGISLGRHISMWWSIGCDVIETDEGLVVGTVHDDGFAARAGLRSGDLVLQLAGAPVITVRDLSILTRGPLRTGVETKVRWLRGDQILTGRGVI
jgi:hypothetical protein